MTLSSSKQRANWPNAPSVKAARTTESRLEFAFRIATGRAPGEEERRVLRKTLDEMLATYRSDEPGARSLVGVGASDFRSVNSR